MGALPGGPFGPIPHYHPDPTEALVNAQLSSSQAKASSSSQGPLPIIAPKPPSLEFGGTAPFHYFGAYPNIHRANSTTALGLGIHHPQYIMDQTSPEPFFAQSSMGMTTSPTQINQPDWFDLNIPSFSPAQQSSASLTSPGRRHTAFARVESEGPALSPIPPFTPPSSQPQSAISDATDVKADFWFPGDSDPLVAEPEDEQNTISGIRNPGLIVASRLQVPIDSYGTQIRSFHSLAGEDTLTNYSPSPTDTPLNDPQTAAVFWYFVNVTAPALSMFERNPLDPSRMFSGETIPRAHQHIWTCEFTCTKLPRDLLD